ncbi:hypothetical protein QQ020_17865 [Fulvivirgaceae bacterium BMA12]|uniref:DUF3575 domain-containing protein n=1 Tax=Agaribacillus aureus TaxID=3051825 RepID=A0ABT8LAB6_9BACT|nr:hypothetical protein [Fulvivirgaceae bacterium BMA12]
MKNFVCSILLLLFSFTLYGQKSLEKAKELGITTSFSIYNYTFRGLINPYLTWQKGKTNLLLGPTLLVASNNGLNTAKSPKLTGIRSSFRYIPAAVARRFVFHLASDLIVQRIVDRWDANAYDERIGNFADFRYQNIEYLIEHYLGYGFKLNVGRRWYLIKGVGIGYYLSKLKGNELSANAPEVENFDYRGYSDFGFSWQIKMGAGLSF